MCCQVTHTALATPDVLARLCPEGSPPFLRFIQDLLLFFASTYKVPFSCPSAATVVAPHVAFRLQSPSPVFHVVT